MSSIIFESGPPFEVIPRLLIGGRPKVTWSGILVDYLFLCATEHKEDEVALGDCCQVHLCRYDDDDRPMSTDVRNRVREASLKAHQILQQDPEGIVAIACLEGRNRSALVAGMVLVRRGFSDVEAVNAIQMGTGPRRLTNKHFVQELTLLEQDLAREKEQKSKIEFCAMLAHEANRVYCISLGDTSQLHWEDAPEWQRQSAREGVQGVLAGNSPEQSHEAWKAAKMRDGWLWGITKDPERKYHPCIVPYQALPESQKRKDQIFVQVVISMAKSLGLLEDQDDHFPRPKTT